jgi:hypothetical protein
VQRKVGDALRCAPEADGFVVHSGFLAGTTAPCGLGYAAGG